MSQPATLVWFRSDLRLEDNPALTSAVAGGGPVAPVFVWAPDEEGTWAPGSASRWWLHQSLEALSGSLRRLGSRLIVRQGKSLAVLRQLAAEVGATRVVWGRRYEAAVVERDRAVERGLQKLGLATESHRGALLFEPGQMRTKQGRPFQVFTPFWKACLATAPPAAPLPPPGWLRAPRQWPTGLSVRQLRLEPKVDWAGGIRAAWRPGEVGARERLERFLDGPVECYDRDRDRPDLAGTSSLSPHLHFGEISPRTLWQRLSGHRGGAEVYRKELVWREFAHHLLHHFPATTDQPLRSEFAAFAWREDPTGMSAWQMGRTGYPLVDAGMRQLWATGWMHNRVRMVTASFLVKHLLLPWQAGARWFWDTLVDADLANNTLGWQWTAGCGADAAPFFRIFNPTSQAKKFDAQGGYIRQWLPELVELPDEAIHEPWRAPAAVLAAAGVQLGQTYPRPIVEHGAARERALGTLAAAKKSST